MTGTQALAFYASALLACSCAERPSEQRAPTGTTAAAVFDGREFVPQGSRVRWATAAHTALAVDFSVDALACGTVVPVDGTLVRWVSIVISGAEPGSYEVTPFASDGTAAVAYSEIDGLDDQGRPNMSSIGLTAGTVRVDVLGDRIAGTADARGGDNRFAATFDEPLCPTP